MGSIGFGIPRIMLMAASPSGGLQPQRTPLPLPFMGNDHPHDLVNCALPAQDGVGL